MKSIDSFFDKIVYFTNDEHKFIKHEIEKFMLNPFECCEDNGFCLKDVTSSIIEYLKDNSIEDTNADKEVRNIIKSINFEDLSVIEEINQLEELLYAIPTESKCFQKLCKDYEHSIWNELSYVWDQIDKERDIASEYMEQDGFGPGTYIILGPKTKYQNKNGYTIAYIRDERDMENIIAENYRCPYTIEISSPINKPLLLKAHVLTYYNKPNGKTYILVPIQNFKKALEYSEVKKYKKYQYLIQKSLAEEA